MNEIRQFLISMLSEMPPDMIVFRCMDEYKCSWTAQDMIEGIKSGDKVCLQWGSDVLRVSRDFIIRSAQREQCLQS